MIDSFGSSPSGLGYPTGQARTRDQLLPGASFQWATLGLGSAAATWRGWFGSMHAGYMVPPSLHSRTERLAIDSLQKNLAIARLTSWASGWREAFPWS